MTMSLVTNIPSRTSQRHLARTQQELSGNLARLSSGLRINTAADDAAGLAISEELRSQIRSLGQAERNAQDGVSLLQTAEGALNEVSAILIRMRELSVQSANGTLGSTERSFLNDEFVAMRSEIDRISEVTEFNGKMLLSGSYASGTSNIVSIQVGINAAPTSNQIETYIADVHTSQLGRNASSAGGGTPATKVSTISITTVSGARAALATIDKAVTDLSTNRTVLGAVQNRLNISISNLRSSRENLTAANSRIRDVDVANETAEMTRNNILTQAGVSVLAQANQAPSMVLSLLGG